MSTTVSGPVEVKTAKPPPHSSLAGRYVRVEPLNTSHIDGLYNGLGRPEYAALWTYMPSGPFQNKASFETFILSRLESKDPFFYTVIDLTQEKPLGLCSLMRIDIANRVVEIGNICFSPALQRTIAASEAVYLLARTVFEDLGYRRLEWKCDNANSPSRRAAVRFGFTYEGLFRQHMIVKGLNRDTAWFSIIDSEWAALREAFEKWLDPRNFDKSGKQRQSLVTFRSL